MMHTSHAGHPYRPLASGTMPLPTSAFQSLHGLGSERRRSLSARALIRILDVIDYSVLLLGDDERVVYANKSAYAELAGSNPVRIEVNRLILEDIKERAPLRKALAAATRHMLQSLITIRGRDGDRITLSVIPLVDAEEPAAALLVFSRRQAAQALNRDAFVRKYGLTTSETRVLDGLCNGCKPADIARMNGLQLCTIRTHVSNIRMKTGAKDIGHLVMQVARLPPLPSLFD